MEGKIYKIVSPSTDKIYIGSTVKTIEERLENHEEDYKIWFNSEFRNRYCTSFEILKYGNYNIELVEEHTHSCTSELLKREGFHQLQNYYKCVNSILCTQRPRNVKISDQDNYTCYCGRTMQNKWKTRYYHVRSWLHKSAVREIHINMIQNNPKFEIVYV